MSGSPFRDEDLSARIEALKAERDQLRQRLYVARLAVADRRSGWGSFFLGVMLLPGLLLVLVLLGRVFTR
jgi:hypothetical protein